MSENTPPPLPGNWSRLSISNTGAWTVGPLWVDRAAMAMAMQVQDHHCNALGTMHGGAMATFLDGQAMPGITLLPDGSNHTPTISLNVDYLAPPKSGDWLLVETNIVKTTRNMIFTQALARVGDIIVARSTAIYKNNLGKDPK